MTTTAARLRQRNASTGVHFTDSFNRADSTSVLGSTDTGQAWTIVSGTWGIISNTGYCSAGAAESIAVLDTGVTDQTVSVTISNNSAGTLIGLVARYADPNNFYLVQTRGGTLTQVYKKVGGAYTQLGSNLGGLANGDVLGLSVVGTTVTATKNGAVILTVTDAALAAGTKAGLRNSQGAFDGRYENFDLVGN